MSVVQEKKLSESYCLLIGLQHDLEFMDDMPNGEKCYDEERRYIASRLSAIKKTLLAGMHG